MVPELMAQNTAQDAFCFIGIRLWICPVKRAFIHNDLPDAMINPIMPKGIKVVAMGIFWYYRCIRHDYSASEFTKELTGKLIQ